MTSPLDSYQQARKLAFSCVSDRKLQGLDPYLPVLDHYMKNMTILKRRDLGVKEIMTDRIAGTCHEGRTESFAANFMPLLDSNSEFAAKWMSLYKSALDEGLRDPIQVYELYGRYFVEEGNKRVSVTMFLNNPLISARVIELIADPVTMPEGKLYESFLQFYDRTGITSILMSRSRNYRKLLKLILPDPDADLTSDMREELLSDFYMFSTALHKLVPGKIRATDGDAFLIFLETYGIRYGQVVPDSVIDKELKSILPAILEYPNEKKAALLTDTEVSGHKTLLSLLNRPIKAALIEDGDPQTSSWSNVHYKAFKQMARNMGGRVEIEIYTDENTPEKVEEAFQKAIAWGAEVIFTSHPLMLQMTNQFAAKYPKIKFLNCSLNPEATTVRSYYTRGYEIQFLQGLAAGAMTTTGRIGYIADYPIYGAVADINAFAIGVSMTRPAARVYLDWSTTETPTNTEFPVDIDLIYISGQDFDTRIRKGKRFGLFDVQAGKFSNLSLTHQKWSVFYTKILSSILNRTYKADEATANGGSINYWLGLSNGLLDVSFSDELPFETRRMIEQIRSDIADHRFFIFDAIHVKKADEEIIAPITMEEVATMNWLVPNVIGKIPSNDKMIPSAEKLVKMHGLDSAEEETNIKIGDTEIDAAAAADTVSSARASAKEADASDSSKEDASPVAAGQDSTETAGM